MAPTTQYEAIFERLVQDPRYLANLDWGVPRPGHPEGSIRAHIADLERNLDNLRPRLSEEDYWKLKILIHAHDIFKGVAEPDVAISNPNSHASLARTFLAEYCHDPDMLTIVQNHDVPFALYKHFLRRGTVDKPRLRALLGAIRDWNLFTAFLIIDGTTAGKSPEPLQWFFGLIRPDVSTQFMQ